MRLWERVQRMLYGRYGNDQLGMFCFAVYVVFWLLSLLFRRSAVGLVLSTACYLLIIVYFFRFLSRNIYKRQRENQKFLAAKSRVQNFYKFVRRRFQERDGVWKLYRCPKCHQVIRVPKGRGKIAITCPKCHFEFVKKT